MPTFHVKRATALQKQSKLAQVHSTFVLAYSMLIQVKTLLRSDTNIRRMCIGYFCYYNSNMCNLRYTG